MRLDPDHLIAFVRVAEAGSVSGAALVLHRSQPAVSAQMRALVGAVGEPLYLRHRHGVRLTPAGEALLPYARALVNAWEGARRLSEELGDMDRGSVRIAASMTVAVYLLPAHLAGFRRARPGVRLELLTRNSADALALLLAGGADLAIVEGPVPRLPAELRAVLFGYDELVLVVPPEHALASGRATSLLDLGGLEVVRRERGSGTREVVDRALLASGVELRTILEATGLEAVKEAVLAGIGAGFLSRLAVEREIQAGLLRVVPLPAAALVRPLTLLRRPDALCSRSARALLAHLRDDVAPHSAA